MKTSNFRIKYTLVARWINKKFLENMAEETAQTTFMVWNTIHIRFETGSKKNEKTVVPSRIWKNTAEKKNVFNLLYETWLVSETVNYRLLMNNSAW